MKSAEELKQLVKEKYGAIALQSKTQNETSCCGSGQCSTMDYTIFSDDYSGLQGYNANADLGLGCGLPTEFAQIRSGDTVVDLGSGAGNDCFVARAITGEKGKVIGLDMTEAMVEKARENADKLGFNNVEFRFGEIEKMPIGGEKADVVISNCVLNLVPDKKKAFCEIFRILKPGGHFSISDVVIVGKLPVGLQSDAEMYAGCVAGAIQKDDYLRLIEKTGFVNISVPKQKAVIIPDDILVHYLSGQELIQYKSGQVGIFSITVYGEKPGTKACNPAEGCC
jgi:SAM-dependent methyltransferase